LKNNYLTEKAVMGISITQIFAYDPSKSLYKLFTSKKYRAYLRLVAKLGNTPRYSECNANVNNWLFSIPDSLSFISGFHEIFVEENYAFNCASSAPYIIDLGANIGLSVLYFKMLFPEAEICALESDSAIYSHLVRNVHGNGYNDVTLINKAAWHEDSILKFMKEGADGGKIVAEPDSSSVEVEAMDVSSLIEGRRVDLLKIDIEGAEVDVLAHCRNLLGNVQHVFVEFHSTEHAPQRLSILLDIFESNGFRYHIHSVHQTRRPFLGSATLSGYDMLLNIFAWKEAS
jgi:methyltransferase, FkbM family